MNQQAAQRTVVLSALFTIGIGWFNAAQHGKLPSSRFLIGSSVAFLTLSVVSDFAPEIAGPLSLAIVTTAFFTEGQGIFTYVNQAAPNASAASGPPTAQGQSLAQTTKTDKQRRMVKGPLGTFPADVPVHVAAPSVPADQGWLNRHANA